MATPETLQQTFSNGRQLAHMVAPGIEQTRFDARFADVVEDEPDIRRVADHLDRGRHLVMQDADIEGNVPVPKKLQTCKKIRVNTEIRIRLVLDKAPYRP